jgi:Putative zinc-finger
MAEEMDRMLHESPEYRQEQLSAALDGMLTSEEQAALDAHLAGCDACTRELEELRMVRTLLRAAPQPALPRSFLLPVEDEPAAAQGPAPAHAIEPQPPRNVTPLRQPTSTTARTLRITRWIGTIAAVLGLALFLGTLLPTLSHQTPTYSAVGSSANSQDTAKNPATTTSTATQIHPSSTQHPAGGPISKGGVSTSVPNMPNAGEPTPATTLAQPATAPSLGDILRTVALALLIGGAALALLSLVVARLA